MSLCSTAELPSEIAAAFFHLLGESAILAGGTDDWRKAYRQLGARSPAAQVVALFDPASNDVRYAKWGVLPYNP